MAEPVTIEELTSNIDLDVRPLSGALGAEVRGLDLATLDDDGFALIHTLLMEYSVLAIHGQSHISDSELHAFGTHWGKLDVHGYSPPVKGFDDILNI